MDEPLNDMLNQFKEKLNALRESDPQAFLETRLRLYRAIFGAEVPVPASMLKEFALAEYLTDWGGGNENELAEEEFHWSEAVWHAGIPLFQQWGSGDGIPYKVRCQLVGQVARAGMKVTYRKVDCVVVTIDLPASMIGQTITEVPELDYLFLAEVRYIDFDK